MARRSRAARALLAVASATLAASAAAFSTPLGGSQSEATQFNSLGAGAMKLGPLLTEVDPDAVCMDGTSAGYYFSPGSDPNMFVIYLEGGYWCWDEPSCQARCSAQAFACGSTGWQPVLPVVGLFSQLPSGDANPFASAQKIYLKYCSSDSWLGDAPASATTFNYAFRGARIVAATIASLQANHGLGSSAGQQLLLGGCSAGARGAISSLDAVAALIPGVDVRGFFDAAGWVDIVPAVQGLQTLQAQAALQVAFMEPPLPASCTAIYSGDELWKCIWPSYLLPMLTTPFFLNAAQFDTFQIMYTTDNAPSPKGPGGLALLDSFQTATLALFAALPPGTSVFSTSCMAHCLAESLELFCYAVNGQTLSQALSAWWDDNTPAWVVDSCTGWACTQNCGPGTMAMWLPENVPPTASPLCTAYYAGDNVQAGAAEAPVGAAAQQRTWAAPYAEMGATPVAEHENSLSLEQHKTLAELLHI